MDIVGRITCKIPAIDYNSFMGRMKGSITGKNRLLEVSCNFCEKSFLVWPYRVKSAKYCSMSCQGKANNNIHHLGKWATGEMRGEESPVWKGDKVKMSGLHMWIKAQLGTPSECKYCGLENRKNKRNHSYVQWANKSGLYSRKLTDWLPLCQWCHRLHDSIRNRPEVAKRLIHEIV